MFYLETSDGLRARSGGRDLTFWGMDRARAAALEWCSVGGHWFPVAVPSSIN